MTVTLYRGVPVEDLSREELIAALKDVGRLYEQHVRADLAHLDSLRGLGVNIFHEPFSPSTFPMAKEALGISRLDIKVADEMQ